MTVPRPRFSLTVNLYLATFFLLLAFLPLAIPHIAGRAPTLTYLLGALIWPALLALLTLYANRRCSSNRMPFLDGLRNITASMMTGWLYLSFLVVLPVLFITLCASLLIALHADILRSPEYSQTKWLQLVHYFYRKRMRQ